jgi:hypothetical protein
VFINPPCFRCWFSVPWKSSWQRATVGAFLGTNVTGTLGDQFVAGLSLGHFVSDAGISYGVAWAPTKQVINGSLVTTHWRKAMLGIDLRL